MIAATNRWVYLPASEVQPCLGVHSDLRTEEQRSRGYKVYLIKVQQVRRRWHVKIKCEEVKPTWTCMSTMEEIRRYRAASYKFCVDVSDILNFCVAAITNWHLGGRIAGEEMDGRFENGGGECRPSTGQNQKQASGQE